MNTPSASYSLGVFISAVVERRSANHVHITEEQSVVVGNLDGHFRMSLGVFISNTGRIKKNIRCA